MFRIFSLVSLVVLLIAIGAATTSAGKTPVVQEAYILKAGRYKANLIKRKPSGGQQNRRNLYERFKFIDEDTRIPAVKGNRFGLRFVILGEPRGSEIEIRVFRHHPPVKNPLNKEVSLLSTYTRKIQLNYPQVVGYGFDEEWELVPGEHRFQIYHGPRKLIEQVFTVYRP
jgi:hypothetical protein